MRRFPVRQWLKWCPAFGWRPCDFWHASIVEFSQAVEGWNEMQGNKPKGFTADDDAELQRLIERYGD